MVSVSQHEKSLRELPCAVSRKKPVTLHHCHGGSMVGFPVGMGQRQNPFLQIPLHADYHTGDFGIDSGMGMWVDRWEDTFGTQLSHLAWVEQRLGYNLAELADEWERRHRAKSLNGRRRL